MGRAREGLERGRGVPYNDAERVARHYNTTIDEACYLLSLYSVEELLPERGYGLIGQIGQIGGTSLFREQGFWWFVLGAAISFVVTSPMRWRETV